MKKENKKGIAVAVIVGAIVGAILGVICGLLRIWWLPPLLYLIIFAVLFMPELIASIYAVLLQKWQKNSALTIVSATALYMLLVQRIYRR